MSAIVQLEAVPNQSFDVVLENVRYSFRFVACFDCMAVDISRDGVDVLRGARVVNGSLLIPSQYQYYGGGNFAIICSTDEIPYYDRFGITQFLIYYTADEMREAFANA